jgi:hypothetical protein
MNELAAKLAKMRFNQAKGYIRGLDKETRLDLFRVAVGTNQLHTRYALPTRGLRITLIERQENYGLPNTFGYRNERFKYLEALVEPLPPSAYLDHPGNNSRAASIPGDPLSRK